MRSVLIVSLVVLCAPIAFAQTPKKAQSYAGCVQADAKGGYAVTVLSSKPAKDPTVAAQPTRYTLELPDGSKIDLATMQNQRVDVIGVLQPVKPGDKSGTPRTLKIQKIVIVPGGCQNA
jgi:hypothetical protein